jgi:imidazole glycerol phosphate synthase glutamine amidotransferase subunit
MVTIINTGVANIRSLQAAFDRLGTEWRLTEDAKEIASAEHLVLPGVGAFAAAVASIDRLGIRETMTTRIQSQDQATLCICLGMQLLCESSEEAPGLQGLGIISHPIKRFSVDVKVPQLGWNDVCPNDDGGRQPFGKGEAYFANSFRLKDCPDGWGFATSDYGGEFVSSVWRGRTLACQFHPELSGQWGQALLKTWLES